MKKEDSLLFVQERLRLNHSPLYRELHLKPAPRLTRRFAVRLEPGEAHRFDKVDGSVMIKCAAGSVWATHDGDPKDVILEAGQSYRCEREEPLNVFALQTTVLEIEFEDELLH